jgi:RimJ/RimL family protein N-acetyltransferase
MSVIFETERLIARRFRADDVDATFAIYSDAEVWRWLGGPGPHQDLDRSRAAIQRQMGRYAEGAPYGSWAVVVRDSNQLIGTVLLLPLEGGPEVEVGYHLGRFAWGQGYATEIARGAIRHGFAVLDIDQLCGVVFPENVASQRVLEKAGMIYRGMRPTFGYDLMYYTIDRPWFPGRNLAVWAEAGAFSAPVLDIARIAARLWPITVGALSQSRGFVI